MLTIFPVRTIRSWRALPLVLLLPVLLGAAGCQRKAPEGEKRTEEVLALLGLVPTTPDIVFFFDQARSEESAIYQDVAEMWLGRPEVQAGMDKILERTGIDPVIDMDRMAIAGWFDIEKASAAERFVVVAEGSFSSESMEKALATDGVERSREDDRTTYYFPLPGEQKRLALTMLDSKTIALGEERTVRMVVALHGGEGSSLADDGETLGETRDVLLSKEAWFVLGPTLSSKISGFLDQGIPTRPQIDPGRLFRSLRRVESWVSFDDEIAVEVAGLCGSEEEAKLIAKTIRGLIALSQLGMKEGGVYAECLASVTVEEAGNRFLLRARIDRETLLEIQKLQRSAPRSRRLGLLQGEEGSSAPAGGASRQRTSRASRTWAASS